jgi:phage FluMu protein gp41
VQFWLHLETLYKEKLREEELFKLIEALVGLGMVQRGSTDFIKGIIDEVVKRKVSKLSTRDLSRLVLGMSLIAKEKVTIEFLENVMQEVEERVKRDKNKFSNLDFIVILQGAFNMGAKIG